MTIINDSISNPEEQDAAYKTGVWWVQDQVGVLLVDEGHQHTAWLEGDEALVWGWLNAGLSSGRCARLLGAVNHIPAENAGEQIAEYIKKWHDAGWLGRNSLDE